MQPITSEEFDAYKFTDQHFEAGRQIHVDTYYYVRQYFQSFQNSKRLTYALAVKLCDPKFYYKEVTLVGCASYFGHFMNECVRQVKELRLAHKLEKIDINYALLDNTDKELSFLYEPHIKKNIIIILPITCTFARGFEVYEFIKNLYSVNIVKEFLSVFLIADKILKLGDLHIKGSKLVIDELKTDNKDIVGLENKKNLYRSFGWESIENKTVFFNGREKYIGYSAFFLCNLDSNLHLGEHCAFCFPDNSPLEERPLIPTKSNHDTPNLIFGLPRFKNEKGIFGETSFKKVMLGHNDSGHLFGHLTIESKSYLHYIERDRFYENNKPGILKFFENVLKNDLIGDLSGDQKILIVKPHHKKGSTLLEDLVELEIFPPGKIVIKQTNPKHEFIENFLSGTNDEMRTYTKVFYFDYMLSNGNVFKMISDYLKFIRGEDKGFDAILTVIDRTTTFSKTEILNKMPKHSDCFFAYFKLNIPLIDAVNSGNPIADKNIKLKQMFDKCHLDFLKVVINSELHRGRPQSLDELKKINVGHKDTLRHRYLLKLEISHEISNSFHKFLVRHNAEDSVTTVPEFKLEDLEELIIDVIVQIDPLKSLNDDGIIMVKEIVIKTLTQSPFVFYKDIFNTTCKFIIWKLDSLVDEIAKGQYLIKNEDEIRTLNFYIKRSVDMNSSYIISRKFFFALKMIFEHPENGPHRLNMKISRFVRYYKELNFKNSVRAIKLEELLNDPELEPAPIRIPNPDLRDTLDDRYYQLGRLIKFENIFILEELKKTFLKNHFNKKHFFNDSNRAQEYINKFLHENCFLRDADVNANELRNVNAFFQRSSHKNKPDENTVVSDVISSAVSSMLYTLHLIHRFKDKHQSFLTDIRDILESVSNIIGENLSYALCIKYKESSQDSINTDYDQPVESAPNIFTILAEGDTGLAYLHRQGIINRMLYGLKETDEENVQTFLALAKGNDGEVLSFRKIYFYDTENRMNNSDPDTEFKEHLVINEAFNKDIKTPDSEVGIFSQTTQMALIFRFADIGVGEISVPNGEAVLVITSSKEATAVNFIEFMNVERIRLLLLIKDDLLTYLRKQYANEAFIDLLESRKEIAFKDSMHHMVKRYFSAMDEMLSQANFSENDNIVLKFLQSKIVRHIDSANSNFLEWTNEKDDVTYTNDQLADLFNVIFKVPRLSNIPVNNPKLSINISSFSCHSVIFEQVIPEIIINMKRNGCFSDRSDEYEIKQEGNSLVFSNYFDPKMTINPKVMKHGGGKKMCFDILHAIGKGSLTQEVSEKCKYSITLKLS